MIEQHEVVRLWEELSKWQEPLLQSWNVESFHIYKRRVDQSGTELSTSVVCGKSPIEDA